MLPSPACTALFPSGRKGGTFRSVKNVPVGAKGLTLKQHIEHTLGTGAVEDAVRLPPGEDLNEWLAVNTGGCWVLPGAIGGENRWVLGSAAGCCLVRLAVYTGGSGYCQLQLGAAWPPLGAGKRITAEALAEDARGPVGSRPNLQRLNFQRCHFCACTCSGVLQRH